MAWLWIGLSLWCLVFVLLIVSGQIGGRDDWDD
jgi:hypothetical protein